MGKRNFTGPLMSIIIIILVIAAVGYAEKRYAETNDGVSCKLGVGGECGIIGSCDGDCDMKDVTLCWAPVFRGEVIESGK